MAIAKQVARFKAGSYDPKKILELSKLWGRFVYKSPGGINFAHERYSAAQEFLVKKHKIKSGILLIRTSEFIYELNEVKLGFIETTNQVDTQVSSLRDVISISLLSVNDDAYKIVIIGDIQESVELPGNNICIIYDSDFDDALVPEKYEYVLAEIASRDVGDKTKKLTLIGIAAVLGLGLLINDLIPKDEVIEQQAVVIDPLEGYYSALTGGMPDVRKTLLAVYELMSFVDSLPEWKYSRLSISQSGTGMIVSAELLPKQEGVSPQKVGLITLLSLAGYSLDLQQQNPVIFFQVNNSPVYNLNVETIPSPINLDQALAYLSDSVGSLIPNSNFIIPSGNNSSVGSNGSFKQKEIQVMMSENYIQHLDYLSIIFSGWPVVLQSASFEALGPQSKYRGQLILTIFGA
jgi:hypothetical protein